MDTWLSTTTDMLRSTSIPLAEIATSAKVELRWLYKFKDGDFRDPGVTKVQRIYDFLRKKQGITQPETPEHGPTRSSDAYVSCCIDEALYEHRQYDGNKALQQTIGKKED